ncbi:signal peptidase I [Nocardioides immobilis]|uniref:Signal peptidase I n=1 Tax=Nocardioides immobilis TaxID=2049295 RepID=A0A417Y1J3_9ACTN|nr:Ig-like domain-containing protein [Nocardioides immobilis]RHW26503.1 signal peptidase I [Nocardioides immobilis]
MSRSIPATLTLLLLAAVAVATAAGSSSFSSAAFVTTSATTATVQAASDWTPPTVAMVAPSGAVTGTTTLSATASDAESGVASVRIQQQAVGADDWTTICTDTGAPYSCAWSTSSVADGQYDLRAVAVDNADYTTISDQVRTVVANNVVVVLGSPGDFVRGNVPLTATIHGGSSLTWNVTIEYAASGTTQWRTACTSSAFLNGQVACTWSTNGTIANGYYDLRAVARPTLGGSYTSAVVADVLVDNTPPGVTMTDPGTPLRGTVTLAASTTVGENESGIAQVVLQYAPTATGTYATACVVVTPPYSCRFATTTIADGSYSFRAVATDNAGNSATSAAVTGRIVDNTVSSVSVEDPGAFLTGTVTVQANATSTSGITSVRIQRAPAGSSTWTDLCTDTGAPYSCAWDTTAVADGLYDLRAVVTDGAGTQTISTTMAGRQVDNAPLRGVDVQTTNGGGTAGKITSGDTVTFTYSRTVAPGTVATGWTGGSLAVTARFRDGTVAGLGTGTKGDTLDVRIGTTTLNLGSVNLKEDYLKSGKTVTFNATLTAATVTVNGVEHTVVTLTIGARASGTNSSLRTVSLTSALVWTPSSAARTADGFACSTAPVTETGTTDREF